MTDPRDVWQDTLAGSAPTDRAARLALVTVWTNRLNDADGRELLAMLGLTEGLA